jgi:hypothetical protein
VSGPRNLRIERLTLHLPPGRTAEARAIAREIGRALAGANMDRAQGAAMPTVVVDGGASARAIGRRAARAAASPAVHPKRGARNGG